MQPMTMHPTSEQYNAFAAMLKNIGGVSMGMMVPVLAAFIGQSISSRPGMVAGFVGGMLASTTGSGFIGGLHLDLYPHLLGGGL